MAYYDVVMGEISITVIVNEDKSSYSYGEYDAHRQGKIRCRMLRGISDRGKCILGKTLWLVVVEFYCVDA